ncbi:MAG: hypothetical protein NTV68_04115 [Methanomicrobiales archaeon]|nr:hypothetical protein [Methanomicrobiales archaeon]
MQLPITIQRLLDLEKIRLLAEGKPLSALSPGTFFQYSSDDERLAHLLAKEKGEDCA